MKDNREEKKAKRGFFARIFDKLDKKLEEKAKSSSCCNKQDNSGQKSCCS